MQTLIDTWNNIFGEAAFVTFWGLIKAAVVFGAVLGAVPMIVLMERKVIAWIQVRPGPNRVGPWGVLQGIADGLKLFFKEDVTPRGCDKVLFYLGPAITVFTAFMGLAIVPFGDVLSGDWLGGKEVALTIANLDVGVLFILAMTSVGVYGITVAGWSSNSKYSLLGSVRASAQMVSYEVAFGMAVLGVLLVAGTLSLQEFCQQQGGGFWNWYVWQQPAGFLLCLVAIFAESNRLPFDLAEAETELGAGFHTEYSSMKFALFFLAEYVSMCVMGTVLITLFLGGWQSPFGVYIFEVGSFFYALETVFWWAAKLTMFLLFAIYIRATLPRLRYDQLMDLGWKVMLPVALINLVVTPLILALETGLGEAAVRVLLLVAGVALILGADYVLSQRIRRVKRYAVPSVEARP